MGQRLYEKYDLETKAYLYKADFFEEGEQPDGYTPILVGNLVKAFLDEENQVAYECATNEEIAEHKRPLIEGIDKHYTALISTLMYESKTIEKFVAGEEISQTILDERDRLRAECNQKISELGVDVSTYRESKRETIILNSKM